MKSESILKILALLALVAFAVPPALAATDKIQDNATTYYNIAESSISAGQYEKAVQYFDMALSENTTLLGHSDALMYVYKDKAAALTDLGRYDEALQTVNGGLALYKNSAGMWNNKGYVLYKMGRYNEAADAYNQAVTIDPTYIKGWINKGVALNASGRYDEATQAYTKALAIDNESRDASEGLAAAKKAAASALPVTTIALVVFVIAAAGAAAWYIMVRKPAEKEQPKAKEDKKTGKKAGKNKK